ncbi:MAG: hypothetical protein JNL74_18205 [Fibrobacteres bacterium]|nr:hypothetical protein [Fibrobacterota bacterium]
MANQKIKIEISGGRMNFNMNNFGRECDKEALFLMELGTVLSDERDSVEYNKSVERNTIRQRG